jgi:myo-inositol-1(or 4)-monophosphatase
MVAAGLLKVARFLSPNIWDVAGGLALVAAGGMVARESNDGRRWAPMQSFEPGQSPGGRPDLRHWRRAIVVGAADAVEHMCAAA